MNVLNTLYDRFVEQEPLPSKPRHCWCQTEAGLCMAPAVGIDMTRGMCVCEGHRPQREEDLAELPENK